MRWFNVGVCAALDRVELTKLTQQYNTELKKKNRLLKAARSNQTNVLEKVRSHSKMLRTFRVECENNKELVKRVRELQSRRSWFFIFCFIHYGTYSISESIFKWWRAYRFWLCLSNRPYKEYLQVIQYLNTSDEITQGDHGIFIDNVFILVVILNPYSCQLLCMFNTFVFLCSTETSTATHEVSSLYRQVCNLLFR